MYSCIRISSCRSKHAKTSETSSKCCWKWNSKLFQSTRKARCPELGYLWGMCCSHVHAAWFHIFHMTSHGFTSIVSQCLSSPHFWWVLWLQGSLCPEKRMKQIQNHKGYKVAKIKTVFFSKPGLLRGSSSCKKCLKAGEQNLPFCQHDSAMPASSLIPICPQRLREQTCHCHCHPFLSTFLVLLVRVTEICVNTWQHLLEELTRHNFYISWGHKVWCQRCYSESSNMSEIFLISFDPHSLAYNIKIITHQDDNLRPLEGM